MRRDILEYVPALPDEPRVSHIARAAQLLGSTSSDFNQYKIAAAIDGSEVRFEPMAESALTVVKQIMHGDRQPPARVAQDFRKLFLRRIARATDAAYSQGIRDKDKKGTCEYLKFPDGNPFNASDEKSMFARVALNICASCPIRPQCLEREFEITGKSNDHQSTGATFGVIGGLPEKERIRTFKMRRDATNKKVA